MKLEISGQVPSLKNQKQLFLNRRTGKMFISSSKASKEWVKDALLQLRGKTPVNTYPIAVTMVFYFKGQHRKDLDNCASSVLDVLKSSGVIVDDDWKHVCPITIDCGGVDKSDPRVEIYLDD